MDMLREGHRKIRQIADAFDVVVANGCPTDPKELAQLRWRLIKEILQHLALTERTALTPLARDSREFAATAAAHFREEMRTLHQQFNAHVARWNGHVDEREWAEYRDSLRKILTVIRRRLLREEIELLPLLPARTEDVAAPPERSWAEEGPHFHAMLTQGTARFEMRLASVRTVGGSGPIEQIRHIRQ